MVRREAAAEVDYLDPAFFVYYDECDFARRLADAGWHSLFVPTAEAVHHDQLSTDLAKGLPRIVEFHRNRDLYMQKIRPAGRPGGPRPHRLVLRGRGRSSPPSCRANPPRSTGPTQDRRSCRTEASRSATAPTARRWADKSSHGRDLGPSTPRGLMRVRSTGRNRQQQ